MSENQLDLFHEAPDADSYPHDGVADRKRRHSRFRQARLSHTTADRKRRPRRIFSFFPAFIAFPIFSTFPTTPAGF